MTGGLPHRFWGSTFLLTNDLKQGELTMLCWFVVPSCGTHKETEGSLRDFLTADIYQNRVNLKLEITEHLSYSISFNLADLGEIFFGTVSVFI